jgi:hypothetical protein
VTIPRKGDTPFLATDACTSLPACGTKLFLQRPGVPGYLPSFNWGTRLPNTMRDWQACEVEAFAVHKGLQKHEHFIKATGNPGIVLLDSKPVYQAKLKLDRGKFSTSRRIQDLIANMLAKKMSIQLISAKLPSPLLTMMDFHSRNPVQCNSDLCRICTKVLNSSKTTFCGAVFPEKSSTSMMSNAGWRDIQATNGNLRRAHAILTSGSKLPTKAKQARELKTYLRLCSVNRSGLIVALKTIPFQTKPAELIVISKLTPSTSQRSST